MSDQRNMIMAIVLSLCVLLGWGYLSERFFPQPKPQQAATSAAGANATAMPAAPGSAGAPGAGAAPTAATTATAARAPEAVLGESPRVRINTPRLTGSIALKGLRIDDLVLRNYRQTVLAGSPDERLLAPSGAVGSYFAGFGWIGTGAPMPDDNSVWTADRQTLTPETPVTMQWDNGAGQVFRTVISVDRDYMFTIRQTVENKGAGAIAARPFALLNRLGHAPDPSSWTRHIGPMGAFNGAANYDTNFKDLDKGTSVSVNTTGGWIGFTDKYWLTALIADPAAAATMRMNKAGADRYQLDMAAARDTNVAPGAALTVASRFFAGAKEVALLDRYQKSENVVQFDKAIDWGWFYWFEKPIFYTLDWLFRLAGNFGVAIILLTIIIRGLMFPVAQRQYRSMAAMRVLQPRIKELQERYKDDKPKLQQEMMALYQKEKVNPFAGCLPIFIQIPIFYALYKVLSLTIEMRHQPFILWIKDLSAPDPLTPVNLFGLLPFTPPPFLALGVLAILLGITMWAQFKLNPAPMDPVQQQVFGIMPWILMFVMAPFAAGLQLYWVVSNLLTIAQQKFLYSRYPALNAQKAGG